MKTPEQIAMEAMGKEPVNPEDHRTLSMIVEAIEADRVQQEKQPALGFLIFTGRAERVFTVEKAERRIEELLDEGHAYPTYVRAELLPDESGFLGITAKKMLTTIETGEI